MGGARTGRDAGGTRADPSARLGPARRGGALNTSPVQACEGVTNLRHREPAAAPSGVAGKPGARGRREWGAAGRRGLGQGWGGAGMGSQTFFECAVGQNGALSPSPLEFLFPCAPRAGEWRLFSLGSRAAGCGHDRAGV